ncbi:hypothetical protein ARMA_2033 [Ardenticatena maritima]|uniref:Uncharacterized protein n=1 Tax=Ardenticatena maritima TaxID=872965 RepID=A0A0M9UD38_9CHLR|nr:hypothetical protein ARMA_2033 [Ardenticatena maritima]
MGHTLARLTQPPHLRATDRRPQAGLLLFWRGAAFSSAALSQIAHSADAQ